MGVGRGGGGGVLCTPKCQTDGLASSSVLHAKGGEVPCEMLTCLSSELFDP